MDVRDISGDRSELMMVGCVVGCAVVSRSCLQWLVLPLVLVLGIVCSLHVAQVYSTSLRHSGATLR